MTFHQKIISKCGSSFRFPCSSWRHFFFFLEICPGLEDIFLLLLIQQFFSIYINNVAPLLNPEHRISTPWSFLVFVPISYIYPSPCPLMGPCHVWAGSLGPPCNKQYCTWLDFLVLNPVWFEPLSNVHCLLSAGVFSICLVGVDLWGWENSLRPCLFSTDSSYTPDFLRVETLTWRNPHASVGLNIKTVEAFEIHWEKQCM